MIDRSDQAWEYRDSHGRFVIAYIHSPTEDGRHNTTVFFTSDERFWKVGPLCWTEFPSNPWEDNDSFTRLL